MTATEKVIKEYLKLTPDEQRSVEEAILENRGASTARLSDSQMQEVMDRREEMIKNPSIGIPHEQFWKELRKKRK